MFDRCDHQVRIILIKVGEELRKKDGLPEEKNITTLYEEACRFIGLPSRTLSTKDNDHLPTPHEAKDKEGNFVLPNKPCPKCGKTMFLVSICSSCKEAEGGKYRSGYTCFSSKGGCGLIDDKTEEWITQRLTRMGFTIKTGTKSSLGIKTLTDEGLK